MTSAHSESVIVAVNVVYRLTVSDGGDTRLEAVYDHGPGQEPEVLTTLAIPRASLAAVAALLARAAERTAG